MDLTTQFDYAKEGVGPGWHWLLDNLFKLMTTECSGHLATLDGVFKRPEKPILRITLHQVKEKFGSLRIYASLDKVDHDWLVYDRGWYDVRFMDTNARIMGYIQCLEAVSANICEQTGERGSIRLLGNRLVCLSDSEFAKAATL